MPRLLLVDDNPSIHKIAETLLAPTDIQLVCVESAQEALNLVAQGERFDVALLDIMMAGTDGWQLLDQLRMHPATAGIPIAMMAGVLDTVDPARLEKASIQGFLKKPVELRDLGERIHKFLEARVELAPPFAPDASPFSTLPAVKLSDLPEFRLPSAPEPPARVLPAEPAAQALDADLLVLTEADLWPELPPPPGTGTEDLSLFAELPAEESLDLEELDLDSLKGLTAELPPAPVEAAPAPAIVPPLEPVQISAPVPPPIPEPLAEPLRAFEPFPLEAASAPTQVLPEDPDTQELPDLGVEAEPTFDPSALEGMDFLSDQSFEPRSPMDFSPAAFKVDHDFLAGLGESSAPQDVAVVDWSDDSENMLGSMAPSQPLVAGPPAGVGNRRRDDELDLGEPEPMPEPAPAKSSPLAKPDPEPQVAWELPTLVAAVALPMVAAVALPVVALTASVPPPPLPVPAPSAPVPAPMALEAPPSAPVAAPMAPEAALSAPAPPGTSLATQELLRAIAADPALLDQLAQALVARLSDQVLREIAWEVMPELAERLNRP